VIALEECGVADPELAGYIDDRTVTS